MRKIKLFKQIIEKFRRGGVDVEGWAGFEH